MVQMQYNRYLLEDQHQVAQQQYMTPQYSTLTATQTATTAYNTIYAEPDYMYSFNTGRQNEVVFAEGVGLHCGDVRIKGRVKLDIDFRMEDNFGVDMTFFKTLAKYGLNDKLEKAIGNTQGFTKEILTDNVPFSIINILKATFFETVKETAREVGSKIATEMIAGTFANTNLLKDAMKSIVDEKIKESKIKLTVDGEAFEVSLADILVDDRRLRYEAESKIEYNKMTFDYSKIREHMKKKKKELFIAKIKTIEIVKKINDNQIKLEEAYKFFGVKNKIDFARMNKDSIERELRALTLLRQLVNKEEFKQYLNNTYIDIPDIKENKIYRIHKDKRIEVINGVNNKPEKSLCIELQDQRCPRTDSVIAKMLLAKNDIKKLLDNSNHYNYSGGREIIIEVPQATIGRLGAVGRLGAIGI